jgi:hypothetical protein
MADEHWDDDVYTVEAGVSIPNPQPGDLSGGVDHIGWFYSAWDPERGWVDVGYDREQALQRAAAIRASALGVCEDQPEGK